MDVVAWLEQIRKLDQLIEAKLAEREQVRELAVNTVGSMDGMPHAPGIMDKVGNLTVKLISLGEELDRLIDEYIDRKQEVVKVLETLPEREYGVLHRYYIRNMTWEQVAEDVGYCSSQIWRIKKAAFVMLDRMLSEKMQ